MNKEMFNLFIITLRCYNLVTRKKFKKESIFAPKSKIWNMFIENCVKNYKACSYATIDEQLLRFCGIHFASRSLTNQVNQARKCL